MPQQDAEHLILHVNNQIEWISLRSRRGRQDWWLPSLAFSSQSIVNCFAMPFAGGGDGLFERFRQGVEIGHVVAVDGPGLRFLAGCARPAIGGNADTLAVGEELLFDACQVNPCYGNDFPVAA